MTPVVDKRMLDFLTQGLKSILADECVAQGEALGLSKGMVEGRSQSLLLILSARGLPVDAQGHERIMECADADLLDRWIRRAATCGSAAEIFADREASQAQQM